MPNVKTVQDTGDTAALSLFLDDGSEPITGRRTVSSPGHLLGRTDPRPTGLVKPKTSKAPRNIALPPKKGQGAKVVMTANSKEAFEVRGQEPSSMAAGGGGTQGPSDGADAGPRTFLIRGGDDPIADLPLQR